MINKKIQPKKHSIISVFYNKVLIYGLYNRIKMSTESEMIDTQLNAF